MQTPRLIRTIVFGAIPLAALAWSLPAGRAATPQSAPTYTIANISAPGDGYRPTSINSSGQVAGQDGFGKPFYTVSGTVYHPNPPFGATCWRINGLNDQGRVVGVFQTGAGCTGPIAAFTGVISGPDLATQLLENSLGQPAWNCAAVSVNDSNTIAGMCDGGSSSREVIWLNVGGGYGLAQLLSWPTHVVPPPAVGTHPPVFSSAIDEYGDVIGEGRCASNHKTSVGVLWGYGAKPALLGFGSGACHSPVSNTTVTFPTGVASSITGSAGKESGPVYISGRCRASGSKSSEKFRPCEWKLHYESGQLVYSRAFRLGSASSRFAGAMAVNESGWTVGAIGNAANTAALWVPSGSVRKSYTLTMLAASSAWVLPGPCDEQMGAAAINASASITGTGEQDQATTGFVLNKAFDANTIHHAKRWVSGSGCQS